MVRYEWAVNTMDGEDVVDVDHRDTYQKALASAAITMASGGSVVIELVRDVLDPFDDDLKDRQWAEVKNGTLPEAFHGGAKIPVRFYREVAGAAAR